MRIAAAAARQPNSVALANRRDESENDIKDDTG